MHNTIMDEIRKRIKSNEINKTINVEKQNRHIRGTCEYTRPVPKPYFFGNSKL